MYQILFPWTFNLFILQYIQLVEKNSYRLKRFRSTFLSFAFENKCNSAEKIEYKFEFASGFQEKHANRESGK